MTRPVISRAVAALALAVAVASAGVGTARAGGAAMSGIADLAYQHGFGDGAVDNALAVGVRMRALAGERLAACFGIDGRAGTGAGGAVYEAALYPIGIGLRYGRTSHLALCGGVGASGVSGGAVPFAWTIPVELHWEATGAFRLVRPLLVARAVRVIDAEKREGGSRLLGAADEIHAAAGLRIMLPSEVVPELATADGIFLGITYDEALGGRIIGVAIGYAVAAHR